ncbi:hypothetical protein V9K67_22600 [Paraflavisolibacter sp. H34]|uniref:hypothetical protein n=1 Tax=Huijunlia imazamoxiresistens TaxID=3127457 RepID=UPI003018025E
MDLHHWEAFFRQNQPLFYGTAFLCFVVVVLLFYLLFDGFRRLRGGRALAVPGAEEEALMVPSLATETAALLPPSRPARERTSGVVVIARGNAPVLVSPARTLAVPATVPEGRTEVLEQEPPALPVPEELPEAEPGSPVAPEVPEEPAGPGIVSIGYTPSSQFSQGSNWSYPLIKMPRAGASVRLPQPLRRQLRGYTEDSFQLLLQAAFPRFTVSGSLCLPTAAGSLPYEPDITLVVHDGPIHLLLDIEIDEPYAAVKRLPLNGKGANESRDAYFTDRGWVVVRLTERQVALQPENCLALIARLIRSVYPAYVVPAPLELLPEPLAEHQWTVLQAQKREQARFREEYLGVDNIEERQAPPPGEIPGLSGQDRAVEALLAESQNALVEEKALLKINEKNRHPRDGQLRQDAGGQGFIAGVPARQVTDLVEAGFPVFDEEYWAAVRSAQVNCCQEELRAQWKTDAEDARQLSTALHESVEKHFQGAKFTPAPEFYQFLAFHSSHLNLRPYRTRWRIYDEEFLVSGIVDFVADNGNGTVDLYDWKRSKKVVNPVTGRPITTNPSGTTGIGIFSGLPDTPYNRYCLQQNVYRYILEKHYGLKVRDLYLVVMHPSLRSYHKVAVPDLMQLVPHLLEKSY